MIVTRQSLSISNIDHTLLNRKEPALSSEQWPLRFISIAKLL